MSAVKNLADLSSEDFEKFLDSFDDVLCDCDGVIWYLGTPLEGASKAIQKLRNRGKKVRFVSNNCFQSVEMFYKTIENCKLGREENSIVFPTMVLEDYLKNIKFEEEIFVLGCEHLKSELRENGFKIAPKGPESVEENVGAFKGILKDNPNVGAVVVDFDINLNYINLNLASLYLKRKEVKLFFLMSDVLVPMSPKFGLFGAHYFQKMLSDVSTQEPIELAKPSDNLADYMIKKFEIKDPKRVLFIGDLLVQDISFANKNGFQSLLVLTGGTKKEEIENWKKPEDQKPNYYIESLGKIDQLLS